MEVIVNSVKVQTHKYSAAVNQWNIVIHYQSIENNQGHNIDFREPHIKHRV